MNVLDRLRGGLIVSVQAAPGSALDSPEVIAAMARAAVEGGAAGVRIQGIANIAEVRKAVSAPIVGLIKRSYEGYEPYITATMREARELIDAEVTIVAFDATQRDRPDGSTVASITGAIREAGMLAMADCALADEGLAAIAAGCDIVATTLCGYTSATQGTPLPALPLLAQWKGRGAFVICEGGVHSPAQATAAAHAGADAVVVGTAITNLQWVTNQFASAVRAALPSSRASESRTKSSHA